MTDTPATDGTDWMTTEEAATALGCSVRTVYRRIDAGKIETRSLPDGTRHVAVPRASRNDRQTAALVIDRLEEQAAETRDLARAAVLTGDQLSTVYRDQLRRAETRETEARRGARLAWASVAVVTVAAIGGGGWAWSRLDSTRARGMQTEAELRQVADTASRRADDIARMEAEAAELREALADVRDELAQATAATRTAERDAELTAADRERMAEDRDRLAGRLDELQGRMAELLAPAPVYGPPVPNGGPVILARPEPELVGGGE